MSNQIQNSKASSKQQAYKFLCIFSTLFTAFFFALPVFGKSLPVPFTVQAPDGKWVQPWADACEEAAVVMVDAYYGGKTSLSKIQAKNAMARLFPLERAAFGSDKDATAEQMKQIINAYLPWEARVVPNPLIDDIKNQIDEGHPVIAPVWGAALQNPHFRNATLPYHVIVISGYDDETKFFITEDPGTANGLDYRYSYDKLMDAIHDFLPNGRTKNGQKIVLFTTDVVKESASTDADRDGLTKAEEIRYGTAPWLADTDKDGYTDKQEIAAGYSPLVAENLLPPGALIKTAYNSNVYYLSNLTKRLILNEQVFLERRGKWKDVVTVSDKYMNKLKLGEQMQ